MPTEKHSRVLSLLFLLLAGLFVGPELVAQTATSGVVLGTVTDPSGAAVPNASVQLLNVATNASVTRAASGSGEFTFANVAPGTYKVIVAAAGFRTSTVASLNVEVNKSVSVPVHLEIGAQNQVVEVTANEVIHLQTQDAQIGNVMSTESILRLPTLQRNATELMNLQPAVVAGGNNLTMRVSGALDDQNTVTLDGIDITQNLLATGTSIPTPADSVEEFREDVANPTASFTRGSGGQVALIGRRGTNEFHGALYEYLQNSDLNSNTWDNNRIGQHKAAIHDNRFGGRLGGPIQKDKTFFFANYEARRFSSVSQINRTVPTATLRQGIVEFQGPTGIEQFNLKTAAVCGTSGNSPCDPRGIGLNPSVAAQFAEMPLPNLPGIGDGLNTSGYFANLPNPIKTDYGVMRLDHVFNEKLTLNTSFTYYRIDQLSTAQTGDLQILNGNAKSAETLPERAMVPTAQLTWQITPTWLNVTRIGWVRDTMQANATTPTAAAGILNVPGSQTSAGPIALLIGSGVDTFIDSPIDMDTQRARFQASWLQDRQLYDDVTKVTGKHQFQFGFQLNDLPFTHARADKVLGSITSLVAQIDGDQTYLTSFTSADRPLTCSSAVTANCVPSTQLTNWDRYYASLLGLVDNVSVLAVRNSNLQPQPFGTPLRDVTDQWAPYFYVQDSWRIKPNLTLYYGLSYGWQTSPTEKNNLQTVMINAASGQEITGSFMQQKLQAALQGQIYNPTFGFATVGASHLPVYNVDYGDVAPRVAVAWNPSVTSGPFKFLGDKKSVIRGGWGMVFDRGNEVQSVEIPMLGIGFDQNAIVQAPLCTATGVGGAGCNAAAGASNYGASIFRVGIDGALPLPTATAVTSPVIPAPGAETLSFQVDPNAKTGRSYNIDFSFQRELPGGVILEAAYIGRMSRDLEQSVNVNSAPYMFVDNASKQSFAQAYDAVANALRTGQTAPVEPWFENQFPGLAAANKAASATAYIVSKNSSNFVNGAVGNLFLNLDSYRRGLGLQAYDSDQAQVEVLRSYVGYSNYNAGVLTLTKRLSRGFMITGNYTYSKALDDGLSNQNNAGVFSNSFYPGVQYGPSAYDRRHVVNIISQYDLPAGNGHWLHGGSVVNHIIGGWYTSGVFSAWSGLPLHVLEGSNVWGGGTSTIGANDYLLPTGPLPATGVNRGVSSSSCANAIANTLVASSVSGTGQDIFTNPGAAYCDFGYIQLSTDGRTGSANPLYGLPFWNLDLRLGKTTNITERFKLGYSADFFNIFNHENFANPSLTFSSPSTFGVINSTYTPPNRTNAARWIEMGLRLDF